VELFDVDLGYEPHAEAGGIATLAPLLVSAPDSKTMAERLERVVARWIRTEKKIVTLGGEHTSVVGAIAAHARRWPDLTVLQLDAHSDLRPAYQEDPWSHACAMARVLDFHQDLIQVGIRSESKEEHEFVRAREIPVFYGNAIHDMHEDGADWIGPIIERCSQSVYVTFDCDVLDPSMMPATGTPEPGGLTWRQLDKFLALLCRLRNVVGIDVSELSPVPGLNFPEFTVAKLVNRFIGRMCENHAAA
jgi:agmatinase